MSLAVLMLGCALACQAEEQRAVLITGASSGIGNLTARTLAREGFLVYAGARKQADLDALNQIENIRAVRLDVTVDEDVTAAVETVKAGGHGLFAVINNAGVGLIKPLVETTEADMDFIMGVNVYGPWRVTRAFMPLLIESKGRVITISSGLGLIAYPLAGAYSMSKHAMEAFSDTLALEMAPFGVSSTIIAPGGFKSDIDKNVQDYMKASGYSPEGSLYADQVKAFLERDGTRPNAMEPVPVANAVLNALMVEAPRTRYLVAPNEAQTRLFVKGVVDKLVQISTENGFEISRDELVEMIDQALAGPTESAE